MSHANPPPLRIEPVRLNRQREAMALANADLEPGSRVRHLFPLEVEFAMVPVAGLWAAYRGRRMVGAMRTAAQAGKTALVTVPRVAIDEPPETAQRLMAAGVDALRQKEVVLAQAMLKTDCGHDAELLAGGGFQHAWDLLFLASMTGAFPESPPAEQLDFVPYSAPRHRQLVELIERTYADSLDCPAIDGVRAVDDVLAGYRAGCEFDPDLWLSVQHAGAEVGCLLISRDRYSVQWELTYMGVVPEARRRGFGLNMARHAQWLVRNSGGERLVLDVDAANAPAMCVYAAAGFVTWDRRSVFLRVF